MKPKQRIELAKKSLKGISIGDAFGESFFGETDKMLSHIHHRTIPETSWEFTDDTVMAIAVFEQLEENQDINQNQLAAQFSINHDKDVNRGYGATARRILREIGEGGEILIRKSTTPTKESLPCARRLTRRRRVCAGRLRGQGTSNL